MMSAENRGKPSVTLVNKGFLNDAMAAASSKGMPGLRIVAEPIASECIIPEQIRDGVDVVLEDIIGALTNPLTKAEKSPTAKPVKTSRIAFEGTFDDINNYFYKRGWTDGLPIKPPTEEAVAEMLTGTDLPPDHLVATCPPRLGKATVEKIAINAVMAGALPTYMPVLISGVKALKQYGYFQGQAVSAGSWAPCYLVNGPVRKDLHINCGPGVMSPGDKANAAIGRAMGMIVKNIGGIRKGMEDMGTMGNPGKYTLVIGENEEESAWEPLHVQEGYKKDDNVLSVFMMDSLLMMIVYGTNDEGILRTFTNNIFPRCYGPGVLLMNPQNSRTLASSGWTKKDISDFVCEYARAPISHMPYHWDAFLSIPGNTDPGIAGEKGLLRSTRDSSNETVRILRNPERIKVFVTGGPGGDIGMLFGAGNWVTQKVDLPANWDKLVKKYEDIAPKYALY